MVSTAQHLPYVGTPCADGAWETPTQHPFGAGHGWGGNQCFGVNLPTTGFKGVHLSLIPKGIHQGAVIIWDHLHYDDDPVISTRGIFYSIWDPSQPMSADPGPRNPENFCIPLPTGLGDLFCAGHAWTAQGDLLVVGGTMCHPGHPQFQCNGWGGSQLAYLWKPPMDQNDPAGGEWLLVGDNTLGNYQLLDEPRWYPSVLALGPDDNGRDRMMVVGGTDDPLGNLVWPANIKNSYQVWFPPSGSNDGGSWEVNQFPANPSFLHTFDGPPINVSNLGNYPRMHLLSASGPFDLARVAIAGPAPGTDRLSHYLLPQVWQNPGTWGTQVGSRTYGSTTLLPILGGGATKDLVLSTGGKDNQTNQIRDSVELANLGLTNVSWSSAADLHTPRWYHNLVMLPDTRVIAFGGESSYDECCCSEAPALHPEVFDLSTQEGGTWTEMEEGTIIRDYHSTALLLPSGKVLTAGGEYRAYDPEPMGACTNPGPMTSPKSGPTDYQLFLPEYLACDVLRPVIQGTAPAGDALFYNQGQTYDVNFGGLAPGITVGRVTLLRPGSITHHADFNQRCVELNFTHVTDDKVRITIPTKASGVLPRGYYMMFLVSTQTVTTQGVPSAAAWVEIR